MQYCFFQLQKKKSKHKEELPAVQVNVTYEMEKTMDDKGLKTSVSHMPASNHSNITKAYQNILKTASTRPTPQGSHLASTPTSIDNRLVINAKINKNSELQKANHMGNGDTVSVSINPGHIAKITLQQQELLKKQTQQLIQLKLQQEKKKLQLAQQQAVAQNDNDKKTVTAKMTQNGAPPQANSAISAVVKNMQKVPIKNNVNIKVPTEPVAPIKAAEVKNNMQLPKQVRQNNRVAQQNEVNRQTMQSPQQQNRKGKKPSDNLQQPPQVQSPRSQPKQNSLQQTQQKPTEPVQNPTVAQTGRQNGVSAPGSPVKGQVRQPPQGQAQNGDVKTPDEKSRDLGKMKHSSDDSPPSDQVIKDIGYAYACPCVR